MPKLTDEQKRNRAELRDITKRLDKEKGRNRLHYHETGFGDKYREFLLLDGVEVSEGGWYEGRKWMTAEYLRACVGRWARQSYETRADTYLRQKFSIEVDLVKLREIDRYYDLTAGVSQCGGCRWHAAINGDYGLCCNKESPNDGKITFEHGGCIKHSSIQELLGKDE